MKSLNKFLSKVINQISTLPSFNKDEFTEAQNSLIYFQLFKNKLHKNPKNLFDLHHTASSRYRLLWLIVLSIYPFTNTQSQCCVWPLYDGELIETPTSDYLDCKARIQIARTFVSIELGSTINAFDIPSPCAVSSGWVRIESENEELYFDDESSVSVAIDLNPGVYQITWFIDRYGDAPCSQATSNVVLRVRDHVKPEWTLPAYDTIPDINPYDENIDFLLNYVIDNCAPDRVVLYDEGELNCSLCDTYVPLTFRAYDIYGNWRDRIFISKIQDNVAPKFTGINPGQISVEYNSCLFATGNTIEQEMSDAAEVWFPFEYNFTGDFSEYISDECNYSYSLEFHSPDHPGDQVIGCHLGSNPDILGCIEINAEDECGNASSLVIEFKCNETLNDQDFNGDGYVNTLDLLAILGMFGAPSVPYMSGTQPTDTNNDGLIGTHELLALLASFGY